MYFVIKQRKTESLSYIKRVKWEKNPKVLIVVLAIWRGRVEVSFFSEVKKKGGGRKGRKILI